MTHPYNALYAHPQEPQSNALYYDDTQGMPRSRPADPLRSLRDLIPENKSGGLSMLNMLRSALGTSANWLDGTQDPSAVQVGPDTIAPLGLAGFGMGMAPKAAAGARAIPEPQGIRAYHGSPHDFERFSMDRIGTGEGSQAFGRGLYFAESPQTAAAYRPKAGGKSYEVDIKGKPDEFLDLDAPMAAQPQQVRDTMLRVAQEEMTRKGWPESYQRQMLNDIVGEERTQDAFSRFAGLFHRADQPDAGDGLAAQALASAGIKGTRFLDARSREAGQGTRNYVVFDDSLIDILRRYDLAD